MHRGWIKLHRKIADWGWYHDINARLVFFHLLLTVNHKEKQWGNTTVAAGQIVTSYPKLAESVGLTVQQTRTALDKIKSTRDITVETTTKHSLITITNWEVYQEGNTPDNRQVTDNQQTDNRQITLTKECKKERMKEEESIRDALPPPPKNNFRGSRLSKDWILPEGWKEVPKGFGWDAAKIQCQADKFKDYWVGVAGAKGIKLDWEATWRNWVRSEEGRSPNNKVVPYVAVNPLSVDVTDENKYKALKWKQDRQMPLASYEVGFIKQYEKGKL